MRERTDWGAYLKSLLPAASVALAALFVGAIVFGAFL